MKCEEQQSCSVPFRSLPTFGGCIQGLQMRPAMEFQTAHRPTDSGYVSLFSSRLTFHIRHNNKQRAVGWHKFEVNKWCTYVILSSPYCELSLWYKQLRGRVLKTVGWFWYVCTRQFASDGTDFNETRRSRAVENFVQSFWSGVCFKGQFYVRIE